MSYDLKNKVAERLLQILLDGADCDLDFNSLAPSKTKNDMIQFTQDTKVQALLKQGLATYPVSGEVSVGKLIQNLVTKNRDKFEDVVTNTNWLEKFVNDYKAIWEHQYGFEEITIQEVKGYDIVEWYLEDSYNSNGGTLGNSCMRQRSKQYFLSLYAENPEKVSLIIIKNAEGKLVARALHWKLNFCEEPQYKFFLDRIYYEKEKFRPILQKWVVDNLHNGNGKNLLFWDESTSLFAPPRVRASLPCIKISVKVDKMDKFPYMDTFRYLYQPKTSESSFLSNLFMDEYRVDHKVWMLVDYNFGSPLSVG